MVWFGEDGATAYCDSEVDLLHSYLRIPEVPHSG